MAGMRGRGQQPSLGVSPRREGAAAWSVKPQEEGDPGQLAERGVTFDEYMINKILEE